MKTISWGTGIIIGMLIFVVVLISNVIFIVNQKIDLVTEQYYKKGIEFQQEIDAFQRSEKYLDVIKINNDGLFITISFPDSIESNKINGEIFFYRPSDANLDKSIPIKLENNKQIIPTNQFKPGFWRVKINWNYSGNNFIKEDILNI